MSLRIKTLIISRTDAIGDVILTLPVAGVVKKLYGKDTRILFFGRTYTEPAISACTHIDAYLDYDSFSRLSDKDKVAFLSSCKADAILHIFPRPDIAKAAYKAGIPLRIGTTNRFYHWLYCNKKVSLSRKNSDLHEAQLNLKLLAGIGIRSDFPQKEIPVYYGLSKVNSYTGEFNAMLNNNKFNLILHPKSHAHAREWSLSHYRELIDLLAEEKFNVFISGSEKERAGLKTWIDTLPPHVTDITGKFTLKTFISFINACDGIVAASTGPLHIAAALGKKAIGIYPPMRAIHPGRWAPLGLLASYLCVEKACNDCKKTPQNCTCINKIRPLEVRKRLP